MLPRHDLFLIFVALVILVSGILGLLYGFGVLPIKKKTLTTAPVDETTTAPADETTTAPADETTTDDPPVNDDETGGEETATDENESNTMLIALGSTCAVLGLCLLIFVGYQYQFNGVLAIFKNQWAALLLGLFIISLGALMVWGLEVKDPGYAIMYTGVGWIWTGILLYTGKSLKERFFDKARETQEQIQENVIDPGTKMFEEKVEEPQTALLTETDLWKARREEKRAEVMRTGTYKAKAVSFLLTPFEYMAYIFLLFFGSFLGNVKEAERRVQQQTRKVLTDVSGKVLKYGTKEYNKALKKLQEQQRKEVERAGALKIEPPE